MNGIKYLLVGLLIWSCGEKSKQVEGQQELAQDSTIGEEKPHVKPIPPIPPLELIESPHVKGRVATNEDIQAGRAVFAMNPKGVIHQALPMRLPYMVYTWTDTYRDTLMVIIQCEQVGDDTLVGVRTSWNNYYMTSIRNVRCATFLEPISKDAFR